VGSLFLLPPLIIVFGGTFSAIIIGFGFDKFKNILTLIKLAYFPKKYNLKDIINNLVDFSIISRKEGLLSIEKKIDRLEYLFPKKLIKYVIDGSQADALQNIAVIEINAMQERHFSNIFIFTKMGGYAPTMGIIGTVMGLIMALASASGDPSSLIKNIASAFIATLWGIFSANILWLPIGDKLKKMSYGRKKDDGTFPGRDIGSTEWRDSIGGKGKVNKLDATKRTTKNVESLNSSESMFGEDSDKDRYLITYADLITLLLGLFINFIFCLKY